MVSMAIISYFFSALIIFIIKFHKENMYSLLKIKMAKLILKPDFSLFVHLVRCDVTNFSFAQIYQS